MEFSNRLKQLIKEKNLSEREFAKRIGKPQKTLNEWLSGRFPRDISVYKEIGKTLNISIHELLYGEPDPSSIIHDILEKTEIHTGLYEITIKKVNCNRKV